MHETMELFELFKFQCINNSLLTRSLGIQPQDGNKTEDTVCIMTQFILLCAYDGSIKGCLHNKLNYTNVTSTCEDVLEIITSAALAFHQKSARDYPAEHILPELIRFIL